MISFPEEYAKTKYPGYFWNTKELQLYSIKPQGYLRPIQHSAGGYYNGVVCESGYRVCVNGIRRFLADKYLHGLSAQSEQVVDMAECHTDK